MFKDSALEQQYLVLNISRGSCFDCRKHVLLRVSANFRNERLTSDYLLSSPRPVFNTTFVWCTTARHMTQLRKWNNNIVIDISATSSDQTWIAGRATLGIEHAQVMSPNIVLKSHRLPMYSVRPVTTGLLQPELLVTLSIRSKPLCGLGYQLYSANISEPSKPRSPRSRIIQKPTNSTISTTTTERGEHFQRYWDLLSKFHRCCNQEKKKNTTKPKPLDNNNDIEMTNSTSSTESTIAPKEEIQKYRILPNQMVTPSKVYLTIQNIDRSKMERLGLYGSSSTFQMIGQPPPTRIPEVPTPTSHDRTPAMWRNLDQPSTSSSPPVQNILKNETEAPIVTYTTSSIHLIDTTFNAKNKKIIIDESRDQTTAATVPATCERPTSAPPRFAQRRSRQSPFSPLRTILARPSRLQIKVKKTVRFKEDADMKKC